MKVCDTGGLLPTVRVALEMTLFWLSVPLANAEVVAARNEIVTCWFGRNAPPVLAVDHVST